MSRSQPITELLHAWRAGEPQAQQRLIEAVYPELKQVVRRQLRRMDPQRRLDTTEYVNESYLELVRQGHIDASNRGHFFGIVATVVRRLVVDYYRSAGALKRGGDQEHVALDAIAEQVAAAEDDDGAGYWLALDRGIDELSREDPQAAAIVELRFYLGMTLEEVATHLDVSLSTVNRGFRYARGWLQLRLAGHDPGA